MSDLFKYLFRQNLQKNIMGKSINTLSGKPYGTLCVDTGLLATKVNIFDDMAVSDTLFYNEKYNKLCLKFLQKKYNKTYGMIEYFETSYKRKLHITFDDDKRIITIKAYHKMPYTLRCIIKLNYDGKLHGDQIEWFKNGKIKYFIQCKNGEFIGVYTVWFPNGKQHWCKYYIGKRSMHGKVQRWYRTGIIQEKAFYFRGRRVYHNYYSKSGRLYTPSIHFRNYENHPILNNTTGTYIKHAYKSIKKFLH